MKSISHVTFEKFHQISWAVQVRQDQVSQTAAGDAAELAAASCFFFLSLENRWPQMVLRAAAGRDAIQHEMCKIQVLNTFDH